MDEFFKKLFILKPNRKYYSIVSIDSVKRQEIGRIEGSLVESMVYLDGRTRCMFDRNTERPLDQLNLSPSAEYITYFRHDTNELWLYNIKLASSTILYKGDSSSNSPCITSFIWVNDYTLLINKNEGDKGLFKFCLGKPLKKVWNTGGDPFISMNCNTKLSTVVFTCKKKNMLYLYSNETVKSFYKGERIVASRISPCGEKVAILEQTLDRGKQLKVINKDLDVELIVESDEIYDFNWCENSEKLFFIKDIDGCGTNQYEVRIVELNGKRIIGKATFQYELIDNIDYPEGIIHTTPKGGGLLILDCKEPFILDSDGTSHPIGEDITYFFGWL